MGYEQTMNEHTMKEMIINTMLVLSLILLIVFVAWYMFGNSPTWEQILLIFVVPMATGVLVMYDRLSSKMDTKFDGLQAQISDIKVTLATIQTRVIRT